MDSTSGLAVGDIVQIICQNTDTNTYWNIVGVVQSVGNATSVTVAVMWVEDTEEAI